MQARKARVKVGGFGGGGCSGGFDWHSVLLISWGESVTKWERNTGGRSLLNKLVESKRTEFGVYTEWKHWFILLGRFGVGMRGLLHDVLVLIKYYHFFRFILIWHDSYQSHRSCLVPQYIMQISAIYFIVSRQEIERLRGKSQGKSFMLNICAHLYEKGRDGTKSHQFPRR
jgi:hypothetical protein